MGSNKFIGQFDEERAEAAAKRAGVGDDLIDPVVDGARAAHEGLSRRPDLNNPHHVRGMSEGILPGAIAVALTIQANEALGEEE